MTDHRAIFGQLSAALNISESMTQRAERLFDSYASSVPASVHLPYPEHHVACLCRCALLAASRYIEEGEEKSRPLTLSAVLRDLKDVDMHGFMLHLKSFAEFSQLTDSVRKELIALKVSFAFSFIFFKKFEELWVQLLPGGQCQAVKQFAWVFFLVCKADILKHRTETVETAFMLIGALHTTLIRFPATIVSALSGKSSAAVLATLSEMLKTQPRYSQPYADKAWKLLQDLMHKSVLVSGSDTEFYSDLLVNEYTVMANVERLKECYGLGVRENMVDEREFLSGAGSVSSPRRLKVPITPFVKQGDSARKLASQKMLRWDASVESHPVTLLTKMEDVKLSQQLINPEVLTTPFTAAMEVNNWLNALVETVEQMGITDVLRTYCSQCHPNPETEIVNRIEVFQSVVESTINSQAGFAAKPDRATRTLGSQKAEVVLKLYVKMLEMMMGNEGRKNAAANFSVILNNDSFHRSLFASCFEAVLFQYNISAVSFEQVLALASVSGFEFWKNITSFCSVDPQMPQSLRMHFRMIEIRILTKLGWAKGSPVHQALKFIAGRNSRVGITEETTEDEEEEMRGRPLHITYDLFFKRVLSFTAYRLLTLLEEMHIPSSLQEEIWSLTKYFLSEKTELLIDRHLDQLVLCAVFGMCKVRGHPLKFAQIVEQYERLNSDEKDYVTRQVKMENGEGTIIDFYNAMIVQAIKEYTTVERRGENARIEVFTPESSLRNAVGQQFLRLLQPCPSLGKSPFRSPTMTPMTKRLFACLESPLPHSSDKRLDFDAEELRMEPTKRPRHIQEILQPKKEINLPIFKKEQ